MSVAWSPKCLRAEKGGLVPSAEEASGGNGTPPGFGERETQLHILPQPIPLAPFLVFKRECKFQGKKTKRSNSYLFPLGFEPRTFRVLGERDNHYTTETTRER